MARSLKYLLVGIDEYASRSVPPLDGCVNDVEAFRTYLEKRVKSEEVAIEGTVLSNGKATRQGIIDAFRNVLGKAGKDDIAVFYYAGHGSREAAPEQFWYLEPDRQNETIVPHDSRKEGIYDIADKELALLIKEVADTGAHFTVILDCCHSGSGTRATFGKVAKTRRAPTDTRPRSIETYIVSELTKDGFAQLTQGSDIAWPVGRHILLAGCRDNQESKEYVSPTDQKARGAFSYFLGETLGRSDSRLTYRDLFSRVEALVRAEITDQNPQLESADPSALDSLFLDGTAQPRLTSYLVAYDTSKERWIMEAGAVHGIPVPGADDSVSVRLFPFGADEETLRNPDKSLGQATVKSVSAARSVLAMPESIEPRTDEAFKAVPDSIPMERMIVALEGDPSGVSEARNAIDESIKGEKASQFVRLATGNEKPHFRLVAEQSGTGGRFLIYRPGEDKPAVEPVIGLSKSSAQKAIRQLAHIGRWFSTLNLSNPTSELKVGRSGGESADCDVELRIYELEDPASDSPPRLITEPEIRLDYRQDAQGKWHNPFVRFEVINKSDRDLYVGLVDLTEQFGIYTGFQQSGSVNLDPGASHWVVVEDSGHKQTRDIQVYVPDDLRKSGVEEVRDTLKLFVATEPFDIRLNSQDELAAPRSREIVENAPQITDALSRLLNRVQNRAMGASTRNDGSSARADWATSQVSFVTHCPLDAVDVPAEGQEARKATGLKVNPHKKLKAKVKIASDSVATRSLGAFSLPAAFRETNDDIAPFPLIGATRSSGSPASVLEISDIADRTVVTPEEPLIVEVESKIGPNEVVLPFAFDGEFYLPVGRVERAASASRIVIERLPEPQASPGLGGPASRSIASSVKIFFRKIVTNLVGGEFEYPRLAAADVVTAEGNKAAVEFVTDLGELKKRVEKANSIVVLIHGIFGDCEKMRLGLHETLTEAKASQADLVLAFDYENLNTPIEDTARALGRKLAEAGLKPGHGKKVTILSHSMGGLVSRWFIEKESGDKVISKLVMMGTPNAGSPWPSYQDWATASLALALNGLTAAAWPATVLGGLAALAERMDTALDQMKPGSDFLNQLAESKPPESVLYVLVAGNTSLASSALHVSGQDNLTLAQKLVLRLFSKPRLQGVIDLFFNDVPNDIAVTVESMRKLPEAAKDKLDVVEVPCDHLSYFRDKASREKVIAELGA